MATTALGRRKTRAAGTTANEEHEPLPAPLKWSLWIIGAGLWLFFAAAMLSFDSSDAPSHAVAVHNGITQNLGGSVGAFTAYWTYHLLGIGAWILMGGAAAWLVCSVRLPVSSTRSPRSVVPTSILRSVRRSSPRVFPRR